ncbi:MAG: DUF2141 domain-containing protein [Pseudomonadota bacterium]
MRVVLITGLLSITSLLAQPLAAQQSGRLLVELTGMQSDEGSIVYAMWSGPEDWLEDNALHAGFVPIEDGQASIEFADLPYGEYAISVYHDRNGNDRLDTGMFRIPKEPIGTSNDAKARFGPPKYEDAAFQLDVETLTITIPVKKLF